MSEAGSIPSTVPSGQAAGGRGGRGGRSRGRGGRGGRGSTQTGRTTTKFVGSTDGMKGHVFQCFNESADKKQFTKTVEALGEYIAKTMKYPGDMAPLAKDLKAPTLTKPSDLPASETNRLKVAIWEKTVASYCTQVDYLDSNLKATHAIIWGQCPDAMKAKLKTLPKFEEKNKSNDCVWLLNEIKAITYQFEGQRYIFLSLDVAENTFSAYQQGPEESLSDYLHNFRSLVEVFEHYGGSFGNHPALIKSVKARDSSLTDPKDVRAKSQDRAIALAFLRQADQRRFGAMWAKLENQSTRGTDQYPADLSAAYSLLVNHRRAPRTQQQ